MSSFIDDQAREGGYRSEELFSGDESDMSDVFPLQNDDLTRARRRLLSDSSDSDVEQPARNRRCKENREPMSSKPQNKGTKRSEPDTPSSGPNDNCILSELRKNNKLINSLSKKMKRQDTRLKEIENKIQDSSMSSSSCATPKRTATAKKEVPCEVRRETRRVYNLLLEDSEADFQGWMIQPGKTFKDSDNQSVLNILIQEVKGLNPTFLTQHIRDAAYRFYRSRTEELSSKRRGTFGTKSRSKRRHERMVRKLQERKIMFETGSYKDATQKEKWQSIMAMNFMSSDESCTEEGSDVLVSKPLSWESASVSAFKKTLDDAAFSQKSPLAKRQMKPRRRGMPSARPKPAGDYPDWAFEE